MLLLRFCEELWLWNQGFLTAIFQWHWQETPPNSFLVEGEEMLGVQCFG